MKSWRERVVVDPKVVPGKPVIKGTWLSVEYVLGLLMSGWTREQVLTRHDELTLDDLRACAACARESVSAIE